MLLLLLGVLPTSPSNFRDSDGPRSLRFPSAKCQGWQGHHVVVSLRVALVGHSTLKVSGGDRLSRALVIGWVFCWENLHRKQQETIEFSYDVLGFPWFPENVPWTNRLSKYCKYHGQNNRTLEPINKADISLMAHVGLPEPELSGLNTNLSVPNHCWTYTQGSLWYLLSWLVMW